MSEFISDELRDDHISALITERDFYTARGEKARATEVDAELARLGAASKPKTKRAEKRPRLADPKTETR
ncbi:MAG: hypothetical protein WCO96_01180 [Actinomycetes bacterium]|jgi:hypothetical protein